MSLARSDAIATDHPDVDGTFEPMRRTAQILLLATALVAVNASAALAHDGGEGWWGETNDKVVTNAGFILIAFFPLFIFVMSMIQWRLEKRKDAAQGGRQGARGARRRARRLVAPRIGSAPVDTEGRSAVPTYFVTGGDRLHRPASGRAPARSARARSTCSCARARATSSTADRRAARRRRRGSGRCSATSREPLLGVSDADARRAARQGRPLLPPRRDLRHDRRRGAATRCSTSTAPQHAVDLANELQAGIFHHVSSIAVAGTYKGHFTEDMFDEGQKLPDRLPPHEVRVREARPRARAGRLARLPAGDRRRQLAHRRDGQDRRPVLLLQGDPEGPPRAAGVVPAGRPRGRLDQHRAGRLRRRRDGPHRPQGRRSTARRSTSSTRGPQRAGDVLNTFARAGHAPQMVDARRQAHDRHAPEGRPVVRDEAAGAQGRAPARSWPTSGSRTRCSSTWR